MNGLGDETCKHGIPVTRSHFALVEGNPDEEGTKCYQLIGREYMSAFYQSEVVVSSCCFAWNDFLHLKRTYSDRRKGITKN
jgi:hypothetical protein